MPYSHEHAARLISPDRFEKDSFRRKSIAAGISIVVGRLKGKDTMTTQTYRFDVDEFTAEQARAWLKAHKINPISFEEATGEAKKTQSFLRLAIQCFTALSAKEIAAIIPTSVMAEIKRTDAHPYFQAYSIAHEGVSEPTVLDLPDQKPIWWFRKAIQSIKETVLKGVKFFLGHNDDNSTEGREELGEIVADTQRMIDGKLHHIVVGYFPSREKVENLDICSQEATWNLLDYAKEYVAGALDKITGIALSNSEMERPAFSGAVRLGMVQAFGVKTEEGKGEQNMTELNLQTTPLDEIVKELKRRQTKPVEIFSIEEIKAVDAVKAIIEEGANLKKKSTEDAEKIKSLEKDKSDLGRKAEAATAKDRLDALSKTMKLTERQTKYVKTRFTDKIEDVTDAGLKVFVEGKLAEYKKDVEFFGVKDDPAITAGKVDKGKEAVDPDDMRDPENNELLPKEIA